jgi:hypothetical protein
MFRSITRMAAFPRDFIGATGRHYVFKQLIQERPHLGRVWLATSDHSRSFLTLLTPSRSDKESFVLKDIPKPILSAFEDTLRPQIKESPYLRLPINRIPAHRILAYKFLTDDFLSLVRKAIPMKRRKEILKASLRGLADLHARDVVHLGG